MKWGDSMSGRVSQAAEHDSGPALSAPVITTPAETNQPSHGAVQMRLDLLGIPRQPAVTEKGSTGLGEQNGAKRVIPWRRPNARPSPSSYEVILGEG